MKSTNSLAFAAVIAVSLFAPTFAQANTTPTPEERFAAADTNSDGVLSREEFKAQRSKRFAEFDTDKSGGLSQAEFEVALKGSPNERRAGLAFKRADQNSDGSISQTEWDNLPLAAFDHMDANKDGVVDKAEFKA